LINRTKSTIWMSKNIVLSNHHIWSFETHGFHINQLNLLVRFVIIMIVRFDLIFLI
jgi:hypothetical protein